MLFWLRCCAVVCVVLLLCRCVDLLLCYCWRVDFLCCRFVVLVFVVLSA